MKILVIHEISYLKKVVYEVHEFPELLNIKGHEITFVDFDEGAKFSELLLPRDRSIRGRVHDNATIRLVTPHRFGITSIDRYWAIFSSLPIFWKLIRKGGFDVILNYAVPTYGLQVVLLGKLFGVPVLQRVLDVSSEIRQSIWNPLIAIFEKLCFHFATRVSTNNPAMTQYVKSLTPKIKAEKISMHYPPLDRKFFLPQPRNQDLARSLGLTIEDKVIVYMGSFFYFSGLDKVISVFANKLKLHPQVKLLLIGGGEQDTQLRQLAKKMNLSNNVVFTGFVPFQDLGKYLCLGDVAINPLEISNVASSAFPNKVLQYMAVGLPTVSTKLDGLYAAFGDTSGIRWVTNPGSTVDAALEIMALNAKDRKEQIRKQSETLDHLFSPSVTLAKLEHTLSELCESRRRSD
jgi:glycosyltransferase involved in cell wall biosynthesis